MERLNTLDEYKAAISIVEYIKFRKNLEFFTHREGKYIHAYRRMKDANGQDIKHEGKYSKKDHLIICRLFDKNKETTKEVYFERDDSDMKYPKSIIDFIHTYVLNDKHFDFRKITGVLNQYYHSSEFKHLLDTDIQTVPTNVKRTSPAAKKEKLKLGLPTAETFAYLKSRNISKDTYSNPIFIGTYGSHRDKDDTFNQIRPAFPLIDEDNKTHTLQTIDFDGSTHKGKYLLSDIPRSGSLYQSNFLPRESNTIILVESPEKAMAHFQLFKDQMATQNVKPFYLSSCGNFTDNDLTVVRRNLEYRSVKNLVTAFDNDKAGFKYTLNTLLTLNYVLPKFTITQVDNLNIHVEFDPNLNKLLQDKAVPFELKDNVLKVVIQPHILFNKIAPENTRTHLPFTKDFLDDVVQNAKLPFHFKTPNNTINNPQNHSL